MLKTKDKRLICLIILGISIVSLLTTLVSGFTAQIIDLCERIESGYSIRCIFISLAHIAFGTAFLCVFFFNKKHQNLVNLIMTCINVLVLIVFSVVLSVALYYSYQTLSSYITIALSIVISAAFMTVSKWFLTKFNDDDVAAEESKQE